MTAAVGTLPGVVTTTGQKTARRTRLKTAEQVSRENGHSMECHLLFFNELKGATGRQGNGCVPQDFEDRKQYLEGVRRFLKRTYKLSDHDLARLVSLYGDNNGPTKVRRELTVRRNPS